MDGQQVYQLFFLVIRDTTAQRIVEIRDDQDSLNRIVFDCELQCVQADTISLVGWDLERAQTVDFQAL